jgi:hypothetical protein
MPWVFLLMLPNPYSPELHLAPRFSPIPPATQLRAVVRGDSHLS